MTEQEKEGRLSRWSRRKLESRDEIEADEIEEGNVEDGEARLAELEANRLAAEEIDLETIDKESDLSIFMKEGVPELLKKQALAALWRSNPVFANIDGLNDYDEDFARPDMIMKTFKSAYQAGRGYLKEQVEPKEEELTAQAETPEAEPPLTSEADEVEQAEPEVDLAESQEDEEIAVSEIETDEVEDVVEDVPRVSLRKRLIADA